ncbi:hypothetical protein MMC18_001553 [Xylographa bjoerkii]|nr:hypothetical protein [Xylographa bjoerkii]
MQLFPSLLIAGAAGVVSHLTYFIKGEHHNEAAKILCLYSLLFVVLFFAELSSSANGLWRAICSTLAVAAAYGGCLSASVVCYRLVFHRLRAFPGPRSAAVSKLWHVSKILDSKQFLMIDALREEYGDFVRTGPNELTVFHPDAVAAVHGPSSSCTKSAWYDHQLPLLSLGSTRSKEVHDERRRALNSLFTVKALQDYEPQVWTYSQQLETMVSDAAASKQKVNATELFSFFSFDVIADFLFGKPIGMLKTGKSHYAIDLLKQGVEVIGILAPVPWLFRVAVSIPGMARDWHTFCQWSLAQLHGQSENDDLEKEEAGEGSKLKSVLGRARWDKRWMQGDCVTLVLAGSGEIASTLTFLFYRLAQSPTEARKLQAELDSVGPNFDSKNLRSLEHLNAIISETLRLHPPILSGSLRNTPSEGIEIAGRHIPGDVTVLVPAYSLHRLDSCFERANEFVPERWYSKPDMVRNQAAYFPFVAGTYACLGKNLALLELRAVAATVMSRYDVAFVPGDDGTAFLNGTKDAFATVPGELDLVFTRRT